MQTCSRCHTQSPDTVQSCPSCQADLKEFSETAVALQQMKASPRIARVQVISADDCCPACQQMQGVFDKDKVPALPHPGCSHEHGCRCFYQPILNEIYP
jgi:hypothetical protein